MFRCLPHIVIFSKTSDCVCISSPLNACPLITKARNLNAKSRKFFSYFFLFFVSFVNLRTFVIQNSTALSVLQAMAARASLPAAAALRTPFAHSFPAKGPSVQASRVRPQKPNPDVVVAVDRRVVAAKRRPAIPGVAAPVAAACDTVRARCGALWVRRGRIRIIT